MLFYSHEGRAVNHEPRESEAETIKSCLAEYTLRIKVQSDYRIESVTVRSKIQRCRYSIVERLCEGYNTSYATAPKDTDEMKILVIGIWWSW